MQITEKFIVDCLKETIKEFSKNELAFLALTTKIELPLRDRWAYVLYNKLHKSDFIVSREWKRIDIAITKNGKPEILIEIKALYTFDAINEKGYYVKTIDYMQKDEDKASKFANHDTEIYTVLFATHPLILVPDNFKSIVKYIPGIKRAFKKHKNADSIKDVARLRIKTKFGERKVIEGVLDAGNAFGIGVEIMYWVLHKK